MACLSANAVALNAASARGWSFAPRSASTCSVIRAAVAMGVGGVSLAMLFFMLDAPHAAGFELSVGAGLISVLFILAISLTESIGRQKSEP